MNIADHVLQLSLEVSESMLSYYNAIESLESRDDDIESLPSYGDQCCNSAGSKSDNGRVDSYLVSHQRLFSSHLRVAIN